MSAIHFATQQFSFPSHTGSPQSQTKTLYFRSKILNAVAALSGFNIGFTKSDHHLLRHEIFVTIGKIYEASVEVKVDMLLRDDSGNYDDPFDGVINVLVIAECES